MFGLTLSKVVSFETNWELSLNSIFCLKKRKTAVCLPCTVDYVSFLTAWSSCPRMTRHSTLTMLWQVALAKVLWPRGYLTAACIRCYKRAHSLLNVGNLSSL